MATGFTVFLITLCVRFYFNWRLFCFVVFLAKTLYGVGRHKVLIAVFSMAISLYQLFWNLKIPQLSWKKKVEKHLSTWRWLSEMSFGWWRKTTGAGSEMKVTPGKRGQNWGLRGPSPCATAWLLVIKLGSWFWRCYLCTSLSIYTHLYIARIVLSIYVSHLQI